MTTLPTSLSRIDSSRRRLTGGLASVGALVIAGCGGGSSGAAAQAPLYASGFVWRRADDYAEGTQVGSTDGNPNVDMAGRPAWLYAWATGEGLSSSGPWFLNKLTPKVWDDTWADTTDGKWARDHTPDEPGVNNNFNPAISKYGMTHDVSAGLIYVSDKFMPVIVWLNPSGIDSFYDIKGSLKLSWNGRIAYDVDLDVVIAAALSDGSASRLLYADTVQNPDPGKPRSEGVVEVDVPISMSRIHLTRDEQIRISIRGNTGPIDPFAWFTLQDHISIRYMGPG